MRGSVRTSLLVSAALVISAACLDSTPVQHVLTIRITATSTAATVGDVVGFDFDATGPIVVAIIVAYGDGVADTVEAIGGVNSASGRVTHAFQTAGTFLVEALVVDAQEGRLTDTVSVNITP